MDSVTFLIKAYERRDVLLRQIKSLKSINAQNILVCDDSKEALLNVDFVEKNDINYIRTQPDIGLSAGRNLMITEHDTEYFILCDDDFFFDQNFNIAESIEVYKESDTDILGFGLKQFLKNFIETVKRIYLTFCPRQVYEWTKPSLFHRYFGLLNLDGGKVTYEPQSYFSGILNTCFISNFFISTKDIFIENDLWWDNELKLGEHEIFFINCKRKDIKIGYTEQQFAYHIAPIKSFHYNLKRNRENKLKQKAFNKYGIDEVVGYKETTGYSLY